jgi:HK97 family phage major capsid protein
VELKDLDTLRSVEELSAYRAALTERLTDINKEAAGLPLNDEQRAEVAAIQDQIDIDKKKNGIDYRVAERKAMDAYLERLSASSTSVEREVDRTAQWPTVNRPSRLPDNIYDMGEIVARSRTEDERSDMFRSAALKAVEVATYPDGAADRSRDRLANLIDTIDNREELERRILGTGSPAYARAFAKAMAMANLSPDEQRALAVYTTTAGGFAVPFTTDPTLILTSDGVDNPIRRIARVVTIANKDWYGVSSGAVTVSRVGENSAVTPTAPLFAQPHCTPTAVKATISYSIEIDQDWASLQTEMARVLQDAKDVEESTSFITATGNGLTAPQGVVGGLDNDQFIHVGTAFGVDDVYKVPRRVGPRWRPNLSWIGNGAIFDLISQFSVGDTGEGAVWRRGLAVGQPDTLLGKPAYEVSSMDDALTGSNVKFLMGGDFRQFLIVDRIGMNLEVIPHMVDSSGYPLAQRGLFAMWRNSSVILVDGAFGLLVYGAS